MKIFKSLSFIVSLSISLFLCGSSFAGVAVSKLSVRHTIKPGQIIEGMIRLSNNGKEPIAVRIYYNDFVYKAPFNGAKEYLPPGIAASSCARWMTFAPQDITLAPGQKQDVTYSIVVPKDARDGGYYGILFYETTAYDEPKGDILGAGVATRMSTLFTLATETTHKKTSLDDAKITGRNKFNANFTTDSNVQLAASGTYYVMSSDGIVVGRGLIPKMYIPFQAAVPFSFDLPKKNIAAGKYTMGITFDLGNNDSLTQEIELSYKASEGYKVIKVSK